MLNQSTPVCDSLTGVSTARHLRKANHRHTLHIDSAWFNLGQFHIETGFLIAALLIGGVMKSKNRLATNPSHQALSFLVFSVTLMLFQNCSKIGIQDQVVFLSSMSAFATYEDTPIRLKITTRQPTDAILLNGQAGLAEAKTENGEVENFDSKTGSFDYIPNRNFNGSDKVVVVAVLTDGRRLESEHIIEVIPVNDLPTAKDIFVETKIGEVKKIKLSDFSTLDEDGETLDFVAINRLNEPIESVQEGTWGQLVKKTDENGQTIFEHTTFSLGAVSHRFRIRDPQNAEIIVTATFSPENPIMAFKPALAVRDLTCIFCHATIKGNVISDYTNIPSGKVGFRGVGSNKAGDYHHNEWYDHGGRTFSGTVFLDGTFFLPKLDLETSSANKAKEVIAQSKFTTMDALPGFGKSSSGSFLSGFKFIDPKAHVLRAETPAAVQTIGEWVDVILNFRSETFIEQLRVFPGYQKASAARNLASIREVVEVKIGHPTEADILGLMKDSGVTYYKQGDDALELNHFENFGSYFGNKPNEVMTCDGDLIVNGPIFLKNLKIKTKYGCRIYATGAVFIEGHKDSDTANSAALNRPGIEYVESTAQSQLQISSARAILMGLGKCTSTPEHGTVPDEGMYGRRLTYDNQGFAPLGGAVKEDYYKIRPSVDSAILQTDAGNCANRNDKRRSVNFERLLLNAPRIDSRYTGDFKGVVIALNSIWSLGKFSYIYDNVFDAVPILPMIASEKFFKVKDCENQTGYSTVEKSATLKSCVAD